MGKVTVEDCYSISVQFLKKRKHFDAIGATSGNIVWSIRGERLGGVDFIVSTVEGFIRFDYKSRGRGVSDEWKEKDYSVGLVTTPCYFGGVRYWFKCNGCGARVGTLYLYGGLDFLCRGCLDLSYKSRNYSKRFRGFNSLFLFYELEEKEANLRVKFYGGRITKRYESLLERMNRATLSLRSFVFEA